MPAGFTTSGCHRLQGMDSRRFETLPFVTGLKPASAADSRRTIHEQVTHDNRNRFDVSARAG